MGYLDMKIVITVFAIILTTLSGKKIKNYESEENFDSELNEDHDKYTDVFDLRGSLRQRFGLKAFLMNSDGGEICSPISALLPLGKLALGAQGKSLRELSNAIGISSGLSSGEDGPSKELKKHLKSLVRSLQRLPGVILDVANRLYVSDKHHLYSNYSKLAKSIFKTSVKKVSFDDPSRVAASINSWVASETHGMIPNIVEPGDISPSTSLVIVNAVYFAGKWKRPFKSLSMGTFHSPTGVRNLPMMTDTHVYEYSDSEILTSQIVRIPYEGEEASFLIVLPRDTNSLQHLLMHLSEKPHLLAQAIQQLKKTKIKLTMPKFKIESQWNLVPLYKKIGIKSIFKFHKSELKGIVRNETIYVTAGVQKAVIDVNELGTEASASSGLISVSLSLVKPPEVIADRPFLFYVLASNQQLFSGIFV